MDICIIVVGPCHRSGSKIAVTKPLQLRLGTPSGHPRALASWNCVTPVHFLGWHRVYTVGIRTWLQGLFRGKWVETSYKGRNQLQGRFKGESTRPVIHVTGSILEPRLETPKPRFEGESSRIVIQRSIVIQMSNSLGWHCV
jgi:hypothetical protein